MPPRLESGVLDPQFWVAVIKIPLFVRRVYSRLRNACINGKGKALGPMPKDNAAAGGAAQSPHVAVPPLAFNPAPVNARLAVGNIMPLNGTRVDPAGDASPPSAPSGEWGHAEVVR